MFLSLTELETRKLCFETAYQPGEIEFLDQKLKQVSPLNAAGEAELVSVAIGEIRIRGRVLVEMETECDRCLETTRIPFDSVFDLFYRPSSAEPEAEEVKIDEGEAEIGFFEGQGVDLKDVLREHVILSLPMQRVCSEACKGICPECGQNRNLADCHCEKKATDDRWSALKNL